MHDAKCSNPQIPSHIDRPDASPNTTESRSRILTTISPSINAGQIHRKQIEGFFISVDRLKWDPENSPFIELQNRAPATVSEFILFRRAINLFGSLNQASLEYQKYRNRRDAKGAVEKELESIPPLRCQIIPDISKDHSFVRTGGIPQPCHIPHAIKHQVLNLIDVKKWYEALSLSHTSGQGEHMVILGRPSNPGEAPLLVSGAQLQSLVSPHPQRNLYLNTMFRDDKWELRQDRRSIRSSVEEMYQDDQGTLGEMNFDLIPEKPKDTAELEDSVIKLFGAQNMTEVLRMTFDTGVDPAKMLSVAPVFYANALEEAGYSASFAIIEQPFIDSLDMLSRRFKKTCYLTLAKAKIKGIDTYKVMFLHKNFK